MSQENTQQPEETTIESRSILSEKVDQLTSNQLHSNQVFKTPDTKYTRNSNGDLFRSSTVNSSSKSPIRRHFRNLSANSNASNISHSNTGSTRKGINLGISLVGPTGSLNNNQQKDKDLSSKTPRRQLFNPNLNKELNNQLTSPINDLNNDLQNKRDSDARLSFETNNTDLSLSFNNSPTPSGTSIAHDELSENFKLLASKELEILEIKNQIKDLMQRKRDKEFELQQLKINIEKQLMSNLKQQNNEQYRHRFENHIPKSPTSAQKRIIKPTTSNIDPLIDDSYLPISPNNNLDNSNIDKRQSWFSKPLNFIQQFDNLIYKEFEKLQVQDDDNHIAEDDDDDYDDDDLRFVDMNLNYNGKFFKGNKNKDKEINAPIKSLAFETNSTTTDVMQSVSNHLWSFVNDVKSNLLIEEEEEPETSSFVSSSPVKQLSQSQKNMMKKAKPLELPKTRVRTASISKRQSYSQHNVHKKRPSMNIVKDAEINIENNKNIEKEFTKNNISNVVRNISVNGNSASEGKNSSRLLENYIDDSDLWDNEPIDI
jgi:hypothetical protein